MNLPYKILGAPGSPYSRKLRSILRYRRIPFTWANRNSKEDNNTPKVPVNLLPVLVIPNENGEYSEAKVDTTPIIRSLEKLKEFTYLFGEAQVDAGADVLTVPDHATGDLVSGQYYQKFLQDIHSEMAERFTVPLILHICGRTVDRMPYIAETGMHAFHFDSKNSPQEAMDAVDNKIALVGNINNPETLYSKDTDDVKKEVFDCLNAGVQLIAPECAIPLKTKAENLVAINEGITDWLAETKS